MRSLHAGQFPVLVLAHGFLMGWDSYQVYWEELVPEGHIVCLPTTESGPLPKSCRLWSGFVIHHCCYAGGGFEYKLFVYWQLCLLRLLSWDIPWAEWVFICLTSASPLVTAMVNFAAASNPSAISAASSIIFISFTSFRGMMIIVTLKRKIKIYLQ